MNAKSIMNKLYELNPPRVVIFYLTSIGAI